MSFLIASPETLAAATSDLANIGATINAANAAAPATNVLAAAADEVSVQIAALFGANAQEYPVVERMRAVDLGPTPLQTVTVQFEPVQKR